MSDQAARLMPLARAPRTDLSLKLPGTVVGRVLLMGSAGQGSDSVGDVAVLGKGPPHRLGIRLIGVRLARHHRLNMRAVSRVP